MDSDYESYIADLASKPPFDAAFELWIYSCTLDSTQPLSEDFYVRELETVKVLNTNDEGKIIRSMSPEYLKNFGPTVVRLKAAHPYLNNEALWGAVEAAAKLEDDYVKFAYLDNEHQHGDYSAQGMVSIQKTRPQNSGFQEKTYAWAEHRLMMSLAK